MNIEQLRGLFFFFQWPFELSIMGGDPVRETPVNDECDFKEDQSKNHPINSAEWLTTNNLAANVEINSETTGANYCNEAAIC